MVQTEEANAGSNGVKSMKEFLDCLTDHGRTELYRLMKVLGMAYKPKPDKMVTVSGKIETPTEIAKIMRQAPGKDKSE
jgi:hypothetical protein